MSDIYIFNLADQPIIELMVNNKSVEYGTTPAAISETNPLPGWSTTAANKYQPNGTPVPRSPEPPNLNPKAAFSQAHSNAIQVQWGGGMQNYQFSVDMEGHNPPLNEDFLLYISTSQAILFNNYGTTVATYPKP